MNKMRCFSPSEQVFVIGNEIISIDWGKNGDKAVQLKARKEDNGNIVITEIKELSLQQ